MRYFAKNILLFKKKFFKSQHWRILIIVVLILVTDAINIIFIHVYDLDKKAKNKPMLAIVLTTIRRVASISGFVSSYLREPDSEKKTAI